MRLILFAFLTFSRASVVCYIGYLNTSKIDQFARGDSRNDGLHLLVVPTVILPTLLVLSFLVWLVTRKSRHLLHAKVSLYGSIVIGLFLTFCSIFEMYWVGFAVACIGSVVMLAESVVYVKSGKLNSLS